MYHHLLQEPPGIEPKRRKRWSTSYPQPTSTVVVLSSSTPTLTTNVLSQVVSPSSSSFQPQPADTKAASSSTSTSSSSGSSTCTNHLLFHLLQLLLLRVTMTTPSTRLHHQPIQWRLRWQPLYINKIIQDVLTILQQQPSFSSTTSSVLPVVLVQCSIFKIIQIIGGGDGDEAPPPPSRMDHPKYGYAIYYTVVQLDQR